MAHVTSRCSNCLAYSDLDSSCRRMPPTAHLAPGLTPATLQVHGLFPQTKPENWCLQHIAREEPKLVA